MPYRTVAKPYTPRRREIARACRAIQERGFESYGPWTPAIREQRRGTVPPEPLTVNEYWTADLEPVEESV